MTWHKSARNICAVCCVEVSEFREYVESRLAARGDGVGRHELLDVVGKLIKGCEKFLEICILLLTRLRNSIFSSNLSMSSSSFL